MRFLCQRITGVQRFAFEICKELDQLAAATPNLKLIGLMPDRPINAQYLQYQFKHLVIRKCGYFSGHLWEQFDLPRFARHGALVNLCNSAPLFKLNQYITLHDVVFMTNLDSQTRLFKLWYQIIAKVTIRSSNKIFTVSQFSKDEILHTFNINPDKVVVLGNAPGIHNYAYDDRVLAEFNLCSNEYFLMIGSNSRRKNTRLVTELFVENPTLVNVKLVVVGGRFSNLGAVEELNAPNIIYTDYIDDSKLRSLYHHAKALIFPSVYEGFGIPVVEAMIEQTTLIVSDIPVLREICKDAAIYFDPTSKASLYKQIERILTDKDLANTLNNAAQHEVINYDWIKFAKIMVAIINNRKSYDESGNCP